MGHEINHDSILALDAQIIQLKRTRNSLLNIARIPPEIFGHIFCFSITRVGDPHFPKTAKGSYNFLLVCHHWSQVALRTPELWTSWGNSLKDWRRSHPRSGISALDLILDGWFCKDGVFDEALRGTLMDRAARDVIRKVHLASYDKKLLAAIISSLVHEGEETRPSSIESIVLSYVDVSDLFTQYRFPKLRNLHLSQKFRISSWDFLKSTTTLTHLLLSDIETSPSPSVVPTTLQILSLLASNPNLRSLTLDTLPVNDDGGYNPRLQVPLRHLEHICLKGHFHHLFPILQRLEFPERMARGEVTLLDCTPQKVLKVIGTYIPDYLRRDAGFGDGLGIFLQSNPDRISFRARVIGVTDHGPNHLPRDGSPYRRFEGTLSRTIPRDVRRKLCIDILALLPQECIIDFETTLSVTEEVVAAMPNLEALHLVQPVVSDGFLLPDPNGPNAHKKLLPSLQRLCLERARPVDDDWDPLVTYLAHQTSGDQAISLDLDENHVCSEVIEEIEDLVEELVYEPDPELGCPFGRCPSPESDYY